MNRDSETIDHFSFQIPFILNFKESVSIQCPSRKIIFHLITD